MKLSDLEYPVESQIIAQEPCRVRDQSRLMILHRESARIEHGTFRQIGDFMEPGSLLVLNDSKVFPARIRGRKASGGKIELILLRNRSLHGWEALMKGKFRAGSRLIFKEGLSARLVSSLSGGSVLVEFEAGEKEVRDYLQKNGEVPLPPYIRRSAGPDDRSGYQTVYAKNTGSVAAPTAGLHFTPSLLKRLEEKGIEIVYLTLHVGIGTFRPIVADTCENHRMDPERYSITEKAAESLRRAKGEQRRIFAVGSTSARALESNARMPAPEQFGSSETDLFIFPGYSFKMVDALITNFHLPRSTVLALAAAFAGRELLFRAYESAIREGYRFYSYGDAMLIL